MFEHSRNLRDKLLSVTKANASGGANSDAIDLEQVTGGEIENIAAVLELPAEAGLSDSKVLTYQIEESDDGESFTAVDPLISTTQTGAGGAGVAAKEVRFRFSPGTKRYVRIAQTASSTPGTLAGSFTFALLL